MNPLRFFDVSFRFNVYLKIMRYAQSRGWRIIARFASLRIQSEFLVFISPSVTVPRSVKFPHPTGIVIGEGVKIGENVVIYQNVTIGGARRGDWKSNNYPSIGHNVTIFAGAVIAGKITVEDNSTIGANSVVLTNIPKGAVAVGAPARIVLNIQGAKELGNQAGMKLYDR